MNGDFRALVVAPEKTKTKAKAIRRVEDLRGSMVGVFAMFLQTSSSRLMTQGHAESHDRPGIHRLPSCARNSASTGDRSGVRIFGFEILRDRGRLSAR